MITVVKRVGMTAAEAAEYVGVDVKTVYALSRVPLSEGGIPCNWAGRSVRYSQEGLDAWLTGMTRTWQAPVPSSDAPNIEDMLTEALDEALVEAGYSPSVDQPTANELLEAMVAILRDDDATIQQAARSAVRRSGAQLEREGQTCGTFGYA